MKLIARLSSSSAIALAALACACASSHAEPQEVAADATTVEGAFAEFAASLVRTEANMRTLPAFGSDAEQAGGYMALMRAMVKSIESDIFQDADYPYFRILDFWLREGGDNPDQRYAFSPVRGGENYRVWGKLGSAKRIEFQLYAGQPWDGTGRSVGYLPFEDIHLAEDGSFVIEVSTEPRDTNWLPMPADATTLFARHIYDDWNEAQPGEVHIDRVGYEGKQRPQLSTEELAVRFKGAAITFEKSAKTWPNFIAQRYVGSLDVNTLPDPIDTYSLGGAKGRWMANGYFELAPDEALLVTTRPTAAEYQAIQLTDMWFASLEYANQLSSLTSKQSLLSPDGAYYTVISASDPGHANWLNTGGLARGVILMRYDGVRGALAESEYPAARKVPLADIPKLIPGFSRVSEAEREAVRAARRRHLQRRSGR